jgi:hypothetical protein
MTTSCTALPHKLPLLPSNFPAVSLTYNMSFSWSAPRVTAEQETLERESLTVAERAKLVDDIYGRSQQSVEENSSMVSDAISDMNMHLVLIPPEEKEAYLEALERCPDLVASESTCITFLRAEHYNPEVSFVYSHVWLGRDTPCGRL